MAIKRDSPIVRSLHFLYAKLFAINDTPHKVAAGVGIGVFFGVLPGLGPLAAIFLAFILRVNRAGALLGSLLVNTWISIPVFFAAVWIGSAVTGAKYADILSQWHMLKDNFSWRFLARLLTGGIALPVMAGYLAVSISIGLAAYAFSLIVINKMKRRKVKKRGIYG